MARFTKWNNPNKRRKKKNYSYDDRLYMATKEIILDTKLGYTTPTEFYEEKYNLNKNELLNMKK